MLERSGCRTIVVDRGAEPLLPALLDGVRRRLILVLPDNDARLRVAETWPHHTVLRATDQPARRGLAACPGAAR
ncbi:MAG: hypothetical protein R2736_07005 [Solirubrobacterales bacterium]